MYFLVLWGKEGTEALIFLGRGWWSRKGCGYGWQKTFLFIHIIQKKVSLLPLFTYLRQTWVNTNQYLVCEMETVCVGLVHYDSCILKARGGEHGVGNGNFLLSYEANDHLQGNVCCYLQWLPILQHNLALQYTK